MDEVAVMTKVWKVPGRMMRERRGTVATMFAFLTPVLMGSLALGFETSNWYVTKRNQQNAADAAAIAASTNAGTNYDVEAKAVAANYGFTDGVNNVTVTASNSAPCPTGGNTCYSVTITNSVPLYLSQMVGYSGNATVNGVHQVSLSAVAIAKQGTQPRQYCLLALDTVGTDLTSNGGPQADFSGCSVMSNSSAVCHGSNLNADYGDAHLTSNNCGVVPESNIPIVADPYVGLAVNIPPNNCASYPQEPQHHNDPALPSSNLWSGSKSFSGNVQACGDIQLTGDVTIDAPAGAVLVIENGSLDTNGHTLRTANGSALTLVFSGTNQSGYTHAPTGGGTLDIQAPTSGPWSGAALYQDPNITNGVDISAAGNSPAWDITGLVYLPHSNVTFSGIVNKSSNGSSCFAMVASNITINGTGAIVSHGGCAAAGLNMPTGQAPGRGQLVQ
jgi:Flp pilus assembly protein TadG